MVTKNVNKKELFLVTQNVLRGRQFITYAYVRGGGGQNPIRFFNLHNGKKSAYVRVGGGCQVCSKYAYVINGRNLKNCA